MNKIWNKKGTINYELVINHISVTIYTHEQGLHFAPYPKKKVTSHLVIWYDKNVTTQCINRFKVADNQNGLFFPQPIIDAYAYLKFGSEKMKKHINRYIEFDEYIYAHYRYPSDEFYIAYHHYRNEIYLWGNEANLERILISVLSMTGKTLPFHAAFINYHGKGNMIIGNSNGGKTSITLQLIKRGGAYIADDIVYIDENDLAHRCVEFISPRRSFLPASLNQYVDFEKGDRSFINLNSLQKAHECKLMDSSCIDRILLISPLQVENVECTKLFCAFHHDSMIGLDFLHDFNRKISDLIDASLLQWSRLKADTKLDIISIDYCNFEESVNIEFDRLFT